MRAPGVLLLAGLLMLPGCTRYVPFEWDKSGSWARSRQLAYLREDGSPGAVAAGPGRHLVMPGDTVIGLARRYGVPAAEIIRLNRLEPPYRIYVGQVLRIKEPEPNAGVHVVRRGETLSHVAARYGLRVAEVQAANPGIDPRRLQVGQRLRLPQAVAAPVRQARAAPAVAAVRKAAGTAAPPLSDEGFLWPVEGTIVDTFGPKPNGLRNDGVNIAAPEGTPVRAAESGVVVYAGEAVPAFGRMLLIRHEDGYLTAYAHNAVLLVSVGDVVRRGQIVAKVGSTGDVSLPQLHFEVRRGTQAVDPTAFFSGATRLARSG